MKFILFLLHSPRFNDLIILFLFVRQFRLFLSFLQFFYFSTISLLIYIAICENWCDILVVVCFTQDFS